MGWTSYHATHYKTNGSVDRKAECDGYFLEGLNSGYYEVLKSSLVGTTYYAAVRALKRYKKCNNEYCKDENGNDIIEDIPKSEQEVFAVVFLTSTDKGYYNFSYKDMDETCGPCQCDCPKGILNLLSETSSKYALNWRKKCREKLEAKRNKKTKSTVPVGTKIRFKRYDGSVIELIKHEPAYQFKRPFWYNESNGTYMSSRHIPENFDII